MALNEEAFQKVLRNIEERVEEGNILYGLAQQAGLGHRYSYIQYIETTRDMTDEKREIYFDKQREFYEDKIEKPVPERLVG